MGKSDWKRRFTPEQLERKRLKDRLGQQKARQAMKKTQEQLEENVRSLLHGQENGEANDLLWQENIRLTQEVNRLRATLETVLKCVAESVGEKGEVPRPLNTFMPSPTTIRAGGVPGGVRCSIFSQIYPSLQGLGIAQNGPGTECFSVTNLHISVAIWKARRQDGFGPQFVLEHAGVEGKPGVPTSG